MPMTWSQNYDPLHAWPLSTLVSALPVLSLFFVLVVLQGARLGRGAGRAVRGGRAGARWSFGMPATLVAGGVRAGRASSAWSGSPGSSSPRSSSIRSPSRPGSSR